MDFGKYKYEKNKKSGQKTHQTKTKEIRLRPKTGDHDVETKVRQAIGFLKHKDKVIVTVMFRGREMAHVDEGRRVMEHVLNDLAEYSKLEQPPLQQGKKIIATLALTTCWLACNRLCSAPQQVSGIELASSHLIIV